MTTRPGAGGALDGACESIPGILAKPLKRLHEPRTKRGFAG
jgi:hypothetical protein